MKLTVNLASRPFFELRPLLYRLRIAIASLAALALILGVTLHFIASGAHKDQAAMLELVRKTHLLQSERATNESSMHQPLNAALLQKSQFFNNLFAEKSFSWTAVMMDLENVLPAGVQVTSIDPAIDKTGQVIIRLRVSGDRDKAVDLIRNLETSKHFRQPRLADEATQTQDTNGGNRFTPQVGNGVQFDIFAIFNPLPLHNVHAEAEADSTEKPMKGGK